MIKIKNKSHLAVLASLLLLSSIGINGIGNPVSFADTSKSVNDMQSAKEKIQYDAERVYSYAIAKAKLSYAKTVELVKDNPDKLRQAKTEYNKAIQIAKDAMNRTLLSANEQYKKSTASNIPSSENNSEIKKAKLDHVKTIKNAKSLYDNYHSIIKSNYETALQTAKTDSAKEKAESTYEFQLNTAKSVYNKTLIDAKQSLDKIIANVHIEV
ncbi:MAG: hypothetical protein OEY17_05265 [Nitrosopumilus sp.]|nr:hypothetical protein [Nitrosopumilus sp.]MDH5658730.1 hypothetical protein [Nitrosopumilus sp.]